MGEVAKEFWEDAQGRMVPESLVKDIDKARSELVMEKICKVKALHEEMQSLKKEVMGDVKAFVELSVERYNTKVGGDKGNVQLLTFDGKYKIVRQVAENLTFDEGLRAAKALIDECLVDWTKGSPDALRMIVDNAFDVNKEGRINTQAILGLRRLEITDERWQRAMQAISDSLRVLDSKAYCRFYERNENGAYMAITLDFAAV